MKIASQNVTCLLCGNVWLLSLQPVCDACGCGSWQSVDDLDRHLADNPNERPDLRAERDEYLRDAATEDRLLAGGAA